MTEVVLMGAGGPDQLVVRQGSVPRPAAGQVLVCVEAAGVAFNDITTRQGRNPGSLPRVLGFDVVGRVEALGEGVTSPQVGQRVAALLGTGGYASHVVLDAERAIPVPDDVDAVQLDALILNYATAWQMLHRVADVEPGARILVLGAAGGVGSALCELALLDWVDVYGTASAGRRAVVEAAGVHWIANAAKIADKVDAVFDPVGGPSLRISRRATRQSGVVVSFGFSFTAGSRQSRYGGLARTTAALLLARLTPGPKVRLYRIEQSARKHPDAYREDLGKLIGLLGAGAIQPAVSTLPLSQAAKAHRQLEERQVAGKLVLVSDVGSR